MRYPNFFLLILLIAPEFVLGQSQDPTNLESLLAKAQQAQARSDYAAAANDYLQAVKLQPDAPKLWANLGLMQHELGKYMQAIESFQHAEALDPTLYVPSLFLGLDYEQIGKPKEAARFLAAAEKINPKDTQPPLALGRAYIALGKNNLATQQFENAITLNPKLSSAWFELGIAEMNQVESFSRVMSTISRDSAYAQELYAESLAQQARYRQAVSIYTTILTAKNQPPCMHAELGMVYLSQKNTAMANTEFEAERNHDPGCNLAILGQAKSEIESGANSTALQLLQTLWGRDHGFVQANVPILFENLDQESTSSFENYVHSATDVDAVLVNVLTGQSGSSEMLNATSISDSLFKARQSYESGQDGVCVRHLAGTYLPTNVDALQLLAACSYFSGNYQITSKAGNVLLAKSPHSAAALYWSIKANEKLAYIALEQFQELEPNSARSHILLGDIYRQRRHYQKAQLEYKKALQISPDDPAALLGLAYAYYGNENFNRTADTAHIALQKSPDDPELNLLMAEARLANHQYSGTKPFLEKSLRSKPQVIPHVYALLGIVDAQMGNIHQAIEELKRGVSSDEDGSYHYQLARLYTKIGDKKNAEIAMEQMKLIEKQSRDQAVIAVQESNY